jgi:hypothetical protein
MILVKKILSQHLPGKIRKTSPIKKKGQSGQLAPAEILFRHPQMQARQALLLSTQHVMCLMYFVFR